MTELRGNVFIDGPAGRIETIWRRPAEESGKVAIVCHPHPLFGGTMHNKVVFRLARAFEQSGFSVLRFNFRGAGLSEGTHDNGRGEQDDLRAAIRFVTENSEHDRLWLAGFSFGSTVMLRLACVDERVFGMIAAGTPVSHFDLTEVASCARPKLFVQGENDEFGSITDLRRMVDSLPEPKQLRVIAGADHFFQGHLAELAETASEFLSRHG